MLPPHALHRLYQYRQSISTRPYLARGTKTQRCQQCLLATAQCRCAERAWLPTDNSFLLLLHRQEIFKPSNTGRLIADLIEDCHGYIWSRTEPEPELLTLLQASDRQPVLVFPHQHQKPLQHK